MWMWCGDACVALVGLRDPHIGRSYVCERHSENQEGDSKGGAVWTQDATKLGRLRSFTLYI